MGKYCEAQFGVGVRGTGQVAVQHIEAIKANPHVYVAAICGRDLARTKAFAQKNAPQAAVYANYEDMLADEKVQVVVECMPNYLHASEALLALEAKKHLVLEKPAGITQEETDALYDSAQKAGVKTAVSFLIRWIPLVENLKLLLSKGALGEIYFAGTDYWHGIKPYFSSYPWIRQKDLAGGAMITGGCHAADCARYLNGEVEEVMAFSAFGRSDFNYDTTLSASVKFCNGSVGRMSASLDGLAFPYQFNIDVLGTEGAIRNGKLYSKTLFPCQNDWVSLPMTEPNSGSVDHHPFKQEWSEFTRSLLGGEDARSTVLDACRSMDVVHAITRSAETGQPVFVRKRG